MIRIDRSSVDLLASIAEIVAAIGVMVSLVYLAIQVNEGSLSLKTQTHGDLVRLINDPYIAMVSNDELAHVVAIGLSDPDALSAEEWNRFVTFHLTTWNVWEYGYYLNQTGLTQMEAWEGENAWFGEQARTRPGLAKFWKENGIAYAEPFHSYVGNLMKENPNYRSASRNEK